MMDKIFKSAKLLRLCPETANKKALTLLLRGNSKLASLI